MRNGSSGWYIGKSSFNVCVGEALDTKNCIFLEKNACPSYSLLLVLTAHGICILAVLAELQQLSRKFHILCRANINRMVEYVQDGVQFVQWSVVVSTCLCRRISVSFIH